MHWAKFTNKYYVYIILKETATNYEDLNMLKWHKVNRNE